MRSVHEVSRIAGVSIRTLHHYDAIGLLSPTKVTEAGYRLYDDAALARLQSILLFRELKFPLGEIKTMLDSPDFDAAEALTQQIELLRLQKERLEAIIEHACALREKGENAMKFEAYDTAKLEEYKAEARSRWGDTEAFREYEKRTEASGEDAMQNSGGEMMSLFAGFGKLMHLDPAENAVQQQVAALQQFITGHYYTCTDAILQGLGQMYTADERFTNNIDAAGGAGTAAFVQKAIEIYCSKKR